VSHFTLRIIIIFMETTKDLYIQVLRASTEQEIDAAFVTASFENVCTRAMARCAAQGAGPEPSPQLPILKPMDVQAAMDEINPLPAQRTQFGCS
jgi:hypothetical protein